MSYQHRTSEELERAAFAEECARHEADVLAKQEGLHHEELCRLHAVIERLLHALKTVLPMVKGYAAEHQVGNNRTIALWAEAIADNPEQEHTSNAR